MKIILVAAFLTLFLVLGDATKCDSGDDCEADECCARPSFFNFIPAYCRKLAQKAGYSCSESIVDGKYMLECPCSAGLTCEPEKTIDLPFGGKVRLNERCVANVSSTTPAEPETGETEPETEEPAEE